MMASLELRARVRGLDKFASRSTLALAAGVGVAYFACSMGVFALIAPTGSGSAWWPAAGLTLAVLLRARRSNWSIILLGVAAGDVSADLIQGVPLTVALLWAASNCVEPALGALALRRVFKGRGLELDSPASAVRAAATVALAGPPVASLIGSLSSLQLGIPLFPDWPKWYVGDLLGIIVVGPMVLYSREVIAALDRRMSAMLAIVLGISILVFSGVGSAVGNSPYLVGPVLVAVALVYGMPGAAPASLVAATTANVLSALGHGPFGLTSAHPNALIDLQLFTGVQLLTTALVVGLRSQLMQAKALAHSEERYRHLALHDPLTQAANRTLFKDRLNQLLVRRHGSQHVTVIMVDLDQFKEINDALGHSTGDALLAEAADRLRACVRPEDTVARLGGDEFAVAMLTPDVGSAKACGQRIAEALRRPFTGEGHSVPISASVGVAVRFDPDEGSESLVGRADLAMYEAKASGGRRSVVYHQALEHSAVARRELAKDLRLALFENQLVVYYQPIRRLSDGQLVALEALVRWQHPRRGLLAPAAFIRLAEQNGVIIPLGRKVLTDATRQAAAWNRDRSPQRQISIHVNVSAAELAAPDLPQAVSAALDESGLDPHRLVLEVTETTIVADIHQATAQLARIRELGVRVGLDDFGTGYSSLGYLRDLPVLSILKLDRRLINISDHREQAILQASIQLAQSLTLEVVAEGVERPSQRELVISLGCELGQGYLFGRPADAIATQAILNTEPRPKDQRLRANHNSPPQVPTAMRKILVVDDHLPTLELLGARLRRCGYDPYLAVTTEEGERLAHSEHPSLILVDLNMPGTDGPAFARLIRTHPELKTIPLIACSTTPLARYRQGVFTQYFDGELRNSIGNSTTELGDQINRFLSTQADTATAAAPS